METLRGQKLFYGIRGRQERKVNSNRAQHLGGEFLKQEEKSRSYDQNLLTVNDLNNYISNEERNNSALAPPSASQSHKSTRSLDTSLHLLPVGGEPEPFCWASSLPEETEGRRACESLEAHVEGSEAARVRRLRQEKEEEKKKKVKRDGEEEGGRKRKST